MERNSTQIPSVSKDTMILHDPSPLTTPAVPVAIAPAATPANLPPSNDFDEKKRSSNEALGVCDSMEMLNGKKQKAAVITLLDDEDNGDADENDGDCDAKDQEQLRRQAEAQPSIQAPHLESYYARSQNIPLWMERNDPVLLLQEAGALQSLQSKQLQGRKTTIPQNIHLHGNPVQGGGGSHNNNDAAAATGAYNAILQQPYSALIDVNHHHQNSSDINSILQCSGIMPPYSSSSLLINGMDHGMERQRSPPPSFSRSVQMSSSPEYLELPFDFVPTWQRLVPPVIPKPMVKIIPTFEGEVCYEMSLLNNSEFTIFGPLKGMRAEIKKISRPHGKAVYEMMENGVTGKWRIPLGAYHAMVNFLRSNTRCRIIPISPMLLQAASLGKAQLEKGYPSAKQIVQAGVPRALATGLAPFQRGGVDFVLDKGGRALIADEMGLGKTLQGIASMAMYQKEWPLLILCPSSARYQWQSEIENWLGSSGGAVTNYKKTASEEEREALGEGSFRLLEDSEIHVLENSKAPIFPNEYTRVVICSYGLAPTLAESEKLIPGQFQCAIADESHMLKNKSSKRTSTLLPILLSTKRCILLSGTPAMARPAELWPQLKILGTERHGWWEGEEEYMDRYVKRGNAERHAELHTMLIGTVMIRRLKADIMKSMKKKCREKAIVHVTCPKLREKFQTYMEVLRGGKGVLGKIARQQHKAELSHAGSLYSSNNHGQGIHELQNTPYEHDPVTRRNALNQMFMLTGEVKIPVILDMLQRWLRDPTKGKVCIFAHHLSVLDEIQEKGLSNHSGSCNKFIRIDGSTNPKSRFEQIYRFQNDPSVRVALLGITAAGVAVTLTASSTVWFAELFWTPSLLVQAEDRCHRIGQQAQVQCLYFVAKGTLDDLLWKLLEKKLQDIGEFVEGKQKMKLVINRTYENERELRSMFSDSDEVESDDEDINESDSEKDSLELNNDLWRTIEELGQEEQLQTMTSCEMDEDEMDSDGKQAVAVEEGFNQNTQDSQGFSQEDAIALSGDEEEEEEEEETMTSSNTKAVPRGTDDEFSMTGSLPHCRLYKLQLWDKMLGVSVRVFKRRLVISNRFKSSDRPKPGIGDVLVAFDGNTVPPVDQLSQVLGQLQASLQRSGPTELIFAEDAEFADFYRRSTTTGGVIDLETKPSSSSSSSSLPTTEQPPPTSSSSIITARTKPSTVLSSSSSSLLLPAKPSSGASEVIEILDDDD